MSALLFRNWDFINFLLNTELKQQKFLLRNLTDSQTDLISEIFFNLAHVVHLNPDQQKFVKRRLVAIKHLSQINKSRGTRRSIIKKYCIPAISMLNEVKKNILEAGLEFVESQP